MEDIITQIEKIREINQQHKLVIFVGAGVSKNSGVCSWWDLVRDMADSIGYNNCDKCKMKYLICSECGENLELCSYDNYNCNYKYNFSTDDFLKIPQYFYDTKGKSAYNDFLKEKFCKTFTPNEIDKLIIELNPEHIITTNYDHLLEDVKHPNRSKYRRIKNDKDMLGEYGSHYIIKMHGDVDEIEKIVLKEDDYLNFSQNHILLETYIKSLLIDKTFLFVGYSLNDNNLRLIMSYIDYFAKESNIKRSLHYMTVNNIPNQIRDKAYWKNKGIELIDLSKINKFMEENTKCDSLNTVEAKSLYSFLKYIKDEKLSYSCNDITYFKTQLLKKIESVSIFKYVRYSTFLKICSFSNFVHRNGQIINIYDYNEYKLY
ncbi:MAG: SIR2 family protein, partial [Ruminococcus flavefaciens]|nr:SIR2 family protein [Ruminococcus flavefaciens]